MKKKLWVLVIVAAVILGLLGWRIATHFIDNSKGPDGRGPRGAAVAVEGSPVRKATLRDVGRFTGSLSARSRFVVAPKISGRLEQLTVHIGDVVRPGQLIATLDDAEYLLLVDQSRAELNVAKANVSDCKSSLDVAQRELERVKSLHEKRVAAEAELDETEARFSAARAKHEVALAETARREAALKAAEVRLSYTRIHASWGEDAGDRVVGERFVDEGELLPANSPIVSILDNRAMTALIDVIERDYPKIQLGQTAVLDTDAFPGVTFSGTIIRISPLLKELSRQARVELEIPNPDGRLKPGLFVRVNIEFSRRENVTAVPASALARREERAGVFLADPATRKARFIPVKPGIADGGLVEIVEPADLSGTVLTLGHHLLEDGGTIQLSGPDSPAEKPNPDKSGTRP